MEAASEGDTENAAAAVDDNGDDALEDIAAVADEDDDGSIDCDADIVCIQ